MSTRIVITDDSLVQDFLRTATIQDAKIFGLFQSADLDDSIFQPEDQTAENLPFAKLFLEWYRQNPVAKQADIAVWIAQEYDLPVMNSRVQTLAVKILSVIS